MRKTEQQIEDSRVFTSIALVAIIALLLCVWLQNQSKDFADVIGYPVDHSEIIH